MSAALGVDRIVRVHEAMREVTAIPRHSGLTREDGLGEVFVGDRELGAPMQSEVGPGTPRSSRTRSLGDRVPSANSRMCRRLGCTVWGSSEVSPSHFTLF